MKFDKYGKRIKGDCTHTSSVDDGTVVTELASRHPRISDSHLRIALDTVTRDKHETFHRILCQIEADRDVG